MFVIYVLGALLTALFDAIFNITKRSMMPEWQQLDSSSKMSEQQESAKKKLLNQVPGHSGFLLDYTGLFVNLNQTIVTYLADFQNE